MGQGRAVICIWQGSTCHSCVLAHCNYDLAALTKSQEREQPELLAKAPSRRRRIARGSGKTEVDVSGLLTAYTGMRSRMGQLSKMMKASGAGGGCRCSLPCVRQGPMRCNECTLFSLRIRRLQSGFKCHGAHQLPSESNDAYVLKHLCWLTIGAPGMMSEVDMMAAMNQVTKVPAGKVRRKKPKGGSRARSALAELRG